MYDLNFSWYLISMDLHMYGIVLMPTKAVLMFLPVQRKSCSNLSSQGSYHEGHIPLSRGIVFGLMTS